MGLPHVAPADDGWSEVSIGASAPTRTAVARWRRPPVAWGRRATLVCALTLALVACDAGQDAETSRETPDTAGVDGSVGSVVLEDVFLDSDSTVDAGGSVPLRGALTNDAQEPDQLVRVNTPAAESVQLLDADGNVSPAGIELPPGGQVDATTGPVRMSVEGVTAPIQTTQTVTVTFVFAHAGEVQLDVPIGSTPE